MTGIAGNAMACMAENGWIWLGMAQNMLEINENGLKWLDMAGNFWNWL